MTTKHSAARAKPRKRRPREYVLKLDGVVIAQRWSTVPYTHALVTQIDEDAERSRAYATEPNKSLRHDFDIATSVANTRPNARHASGGTISASEIEWAKREIEGGFDAYVERERQRRIEYFEERKATGGYKPKVEKWLRREEVAKKVAEYNERNARDRYYKLIRVAPVRARTFTGNGIIHALEIPSRFESLDNVGVTKIG